MTDKRRRNLMWLGGAALAYGALSQGPRLYRHAFPPDFDFAPVAGLPGFRRIDRGDISAAPPLFIGLDKDRAVRLPEEFLRDDLCGYLFGPGRPGVVPVAYFTDIRCQYCRIVTPLLRARADAAAPSIRLAWHELPLLGESSALAARAVLAAAAQGAGPDMHARLSGARLVPTRDALKRVAEGIGLNGGRLVDEMDAPWIDEKLAASRGLAGLFGFPGTPALVVGRTAVLGRIEPAELDRLIALEAAETTRPPCA